MGPNTGLPQGGGGLKAVGVRDGLRAWGAGVPGWLWVVLIWAALFLPNLELRSLYWEEGRRALMALDILAEGNWLQPQVLGRPYLNKPPLLPWLIALGGRLLGGVDEWAVRLPALLASLGGGLLVYALIRREAGSGRAVLAALVFFLTPVILEKVRVGETDTTVTVFSLAAFLVWWRGFGEDRVTLSRWLLCGLLLCPASLAKGPVPLGYFACGVGLAAVTGRRWSDLAGLGLSLCLPLAAVGLWAWWVYQPGDGLLWSQEMRLIVPQRTLPAYLLRQLRFNGELVLAFLPWLLFLGWGLLLTRREGPAAGSRLGPALLWYGLGFTVILVFWPETQPRYAMPAAPALAAGLGLVAGRLWEAPWSRRLLAASVVLLAGYQLLSSLVLLPLHQEKYALTRTAGQEIRGLVGQEPGRIFLMTDEDQHNVAFYTGLKIRELRPSQAGELRGPGWLITSPELIPHLSRARPDLFPGGTGERAARIGARRDRTLLLVRLEG